jgi:hypothetical protein
MRERGPCLMVGADVGLSDAAKAKFNAKPDVKTAALK